MSKKNSVCSIGVSCSRWIHIGFGVYAVGWAAQALAAPITFNTALPVAKGEFVARIQAVRAQSGDDPSGADRDRTETAAVAALGYGLTGDFALFGVLPYRDIALDITAPGGRITRDNNGVGDLTLFGRYTAYQKDSRALTFRVAPFAGFKTPTGDDDTSDALGTLPPPVQVGTGSWDVFGGVVATYQSLAYQIDSQIQYRINNEANGFEAGDTTRWDGSLQYRLLPRKVSGGIPAFLYAVIEANLIYQGKNRIGGTKDPNSGGTRMFLAPGLQYVTKRWIIEGVVQIPLVQNLNGTTLETDYIVRGGVRFNF